MEACCWGWGRIARIRWLLSSLLAYQNCRFGSFAYLLHLRAFSKPQKYLNIPMLQLHPYLRTMVPLRFQQFSAHRIVGEWILLGLLWVNLLLKDGRHFSPSSIFWSCLLKDCSFVTHPHSSRRKNAYSIRPPGEMSMFPIHRCWWMRNYQLSHIKKVYKILLTLFEYILQKSISVSGWTLSQLCQKNNSSGCVLNQTYYFTCNITFI